MEADAKRADAVINRERVIAAARRAFGTGGLKVSMNVIAKRAGVGVGTLYRHFPTKEALFAAIVEERMLETAQRARRAARAKSPGKAFFELIEALWSDGFQKKSLVDALVASGADLRALSRKASTELHGALGTVLRRAQKSGAVRPGIGVPDLLALLSAAMTAAQRPGTSPDRLFQVISEGLEGR